MALVNRTGGPRGGRFGARRGAVLLQRRMDAQGCTPRGALRCAVAAAMVMIVRFRNTFAVRPAPATGWRGMGR